MSETVDERLYALGRRVQVLEVEVAELRAAISTQRPVPRLGTPAPPSRPQPAPPPVEWKPSPRPLPRSLRPEQRRVQPPPKTRREIELADLLGARTLAVAGGVVTLLGILFFFVLAVERGWIGPGARVSLGAIASLLVFAAGLELRRRYGESHSSLAAVGAGIAGGFGTLLAAAALYSLIPDYAALVAAAAIAATGTATALAWRAQLVAGLGLVGAAFVPIVEAAQGGLTTLGTAFAAVVYAATAIVAIRMRWRHLLIACTVATAPQIAALVAQTGTPTSARAVVAAAFWLLYMAAGIAWNLRVEAPRLRTLSRSLLVLGAWLATGAAFALFSAPAQGWTALASATVFGLIAAVYFSSRRTLNLSAFLAAIGLTIGAIAVADLLSGQPLAYAWATEAAVLAWLARRLREPRYQVWSLAYLGLTLAHVLAFDAPLSSLFGRTEDPARGAGTVLALGASVFAFYARSGRQRRVSGWFAPLFQTLAESQPVLRASSLWASGVLAAYAFALVVLEVAVAIGGTGTGFDWGHVVVGAAWAAAGLGILVAGLKRGSFQLRTGGLVWLALTALDVAVYDSIALTTTPRATAFLIVAGLALAAAVADQMLARTLWSWPAVGLVGTSIVLSVTGVVQLAPDGDVQGAGLLGLACVYGLLSARLFRERHFTTLLWSIALVLAAVAAPQLVGGTYLVLAWTAAAVGLSGVAVRVDEPRLQIGAAAYAALGFGHALVLEAPPSHLFVARPHPATGVPALLLVALATALLAGNLGTANEVERRGRVTAWWIAGLVGLYAASLSILELLERISPEDVQTNFQRGHTAVSALWGLLGLVLLYLGLTRVLALRVAGFVLFGLGLAKIFLYDLRELSSVTRALSFLAVGAVLLLGGFFYQRLSARARGDGGAPA